MCFISLYLYLIHLANNPRIIIGMNLFDSLQHQQCYIYMSTYYNALELLFVSSLWWLNISLSIKEITVLTTFD